MAKVSIIIPVYNVEEYIESCLVSALEQTNQDIEIILVDDRGSDKSIEIAEKVIKNHPRGNKARIVIHESNKGLSSARNTGIELSTGEYLYFLDSDDEIPPYTVEIMLEQVERYHNPDFVIGSYSTLGKQLNIPQLQLENGLLQGNDAILGSFVSQKWYVMGCNKLLKRSFLIDNNLFFEEGLLHEDIIWSFKLACNASSMVIVNEITYKYRIREGSIIHDNAKKLLTHYFKNIDLAFQYIKDKDKFNCCTYEYLELVKKYAFSRKIQLNYSMVDKKETYLLFKRYEKYFTSIKLPFKMQLQSYHYRLPSSIGFYLYLYYITGVNFKRKIFSH